MKKNTDEVEQCLDLLGRVFDTNRAKLRGFEQALEALDRGNSVLLTGRPASGKSTFLACQTLGRPEAAVLCGSGKQATRLSARAMELRTLHANAEAVGSCRSFTSEVFSRLNSWRQSQHLPPVRLATDAEVYTQFKEFTENLEIPPDLREAVGTRTFIKDLVDGVFRVRVLGAKSLAGLKTVHPLVKDIIEVMRREREQNRSRARSQAWPLDTASLMEEYLDALNQDAPVPQFIAVDDWQNANGLMNEILLGWASRGTQVLAACSPETAVNDYRGGDTYVWEDLRTSLHGIVGREVTEVLLREQFVSPGLRIFWRQIVSRMGVNAAGVRLWAPDSTDDDAPLAPDPLRVVKLVEGKSDTEQYRAVASLLQASHISEEAPIPYEDMAVVARTLSVAQEAAGVFKSMGIPVAVPESTAQLNEGRITSWLLKLMQVACSDVPLFEASTDLDFFSLLTSALIGWDVWKARELDIQLHDLSLLQTSGSDLGNREDRDDPENEIGATAGVLGYVKLFWKSLLEGKDYAGLKLDEIEEQAPQASVLRRVAQALQDARQTWEQDPAAVQLILWRLWNGIGRGEELRRYALCADLDAQVRELIHVDLDLVMDLAKAADWFEARNPGMTAANFAENMLRRNLPTGTVAPHHVSKGAVTFTTPSSAVSRHWKIVAVVGLTSENWPSGKWPGNVLKTSMFDLFSHQEESGTVQAAGFQWSWQNEMRNVFAALTRGQESLILGTTRGGGVDVSPFLAPALDSLSLHPCETSKGLPSNLRDYTAYLRKLAMNPSGTSIPEEESATAVGILAGLSARGYAPAMPKNWLGTLSPTESEKVDLVHVRASQLEKALENPLDTVLGWNGFSDEEADPLAERMVGNLVHEAAWRVGEAHWNLNQHVETDLSEEQILQELQAVVSSRLPELSETVWEKNFNQKVNVCLGPLANFLAENQYPSLFEYTCQGRIPSSNGKGAITYSARIDRVIFRQDGVQLLDYKTGEPKQFSQSRVESNLQLMLYRKAFERSEAGRGKPCRGASIVALKVPPKDPLAEDVPLQDLQPGVVNQPGDWNTVITLPNPFSAEHRQLLKNPQAWLRGEEPGESDDEQMKMSDFLQDRVDLAVSAFGGPELARLVSSSKWGEGKYLHLEVQGR